MSNYTDNGWTEDLPILNLGRFGHGCGHYMNGNSTLVKNTIQEFTRVSN